MLRIAIETGFVRRLARRADRPAFPLVAAGVALAAACPDMRRSSARADATRWLTSYGLAAMPVIAALPLPLTPALLFAGISPLPFAEVLLALWLGKLVKYAAYAWFACAFPEHFVRRVHHRVAALGEAISRVATPDSGRR